MASKLFVIVQGNRFQAARAAADRGIPFVYVSEISNHTETTGHVGAQFLQDVQAWRQQSEARLPRIGDCIQFDPLDDLPAVRPAVLVVDVEPMDAFEELTLYPTSVEPPEAAQDPYANQCEFRNEAAPLPEWA